MYYLITVLFILLSAKGSFLYFANVWWFAIDVIIIWVGVEKGRFTKRDFKLLLTFSSLYIGFCTFRSLFLVHLPLSFWVSDVVFLFKFILTSFLYCAVLKDKAIHYLTKVIIHLAIISVPLYCLQLISGDLVYSIGTTINLPPHFVNQQYTNFLVFTYVKQHAIRNSGFSWEPGAFGFFLNTALLMHFLDNNFTFDKKAKWVVVAIITTISTTSYIALLVIVLMYFRTRGLKYTTLAIFIVPLLCVAAFALPFLVDKIVYIYNSDLADMNNIEFLSNYYFRRGQQMPLNRFSSMLYLCKLFGMNMLWGISNIYEDTVPILKTINISNGIFAFMAKFGLIGLAYLLNRCYVLVKKFTNSAEIGVYYIVIILIMGFGEQIFLIPLMMCFFFLYYYSVPEDEETSLTEFGSDTEQIESLGD